MSKSSSITQEFNAIQTSLEVLEPLDASLLPRSDPVALG